MSETNVQQPPDIQEPVQKPWREKLLRNWMFARLGHEGMMLGKIVRQNRMVEDLARCAATGDLSKMGETMDEDDTGVSIGNETHNHYQASQSSKVWPVLAAALLGGGLVLAAMQFLPDETPEKPPAVTDTDTDTVNRYDVSFGVPEDRQPGE